MPLWLFAVIVVGGIAGVIALIHFLGFSRQFHINNDDVTRTQWLRHWPDDQIQSLRRAKEGHAALVESQNGPGLLWSFGADTTARHIQSATTTPCETGLIFTLHDFTAPHVTITLGADEAKQWQSEIERMQS